MLGTTRQEPGLTRTGVWQVGTRRLKMLNAGTFLYMMHSGPKVGRYLNLFCKLETKLCNTLKYYHKAKKPEYEYENFRFYILKSLS